MSDTTDMVETSTEEGVDVFEDVTQDVVAPPEGGFCDGKFWDLSLTWNTEDPDFTPCFHQTVRDAYQRAHNEISTYGTFKPKSLHQ